MEKNRKQTFLLAMEKAGLNNNPDNLIDLYSILDGTERPEDMPAIVYDYLDRYCSNKPNDRWTWHGYTIYHQLKRLLKAYKEITEVLHNTKP